MLSTSAFLAVAMQCAATVHPSTSLDVARVESGLNPYAIGIVGQKQGYSQNKRGGFKAYRHAEITGQAIFTGADANYQYQLSKIPCL